MARSLRAQRSFTIGVVVRRSAKDTAALVMSGIEDHLLEEGYFLFCGQPSPPGRFDPGIPAVAAAARGEGLIAVTRRARRVR